MTISPSTDAAAAYYLWLGKRLHRKEDLRGAERAWREAIEAEPQGIESRLQLAALLAVRYRYADAREQLEEILRVAPRERRARQLLRTMDKLEQGR
jgi:Flp pilus assembly protein TadD